MVSLTGAERICTALCAERICTALCNSTVCSPCVVIHLRLNTWDATNSAHAFRLNANTGVKTEGDAQLKLWVERVVAGGLHMANSTCDAG